MQPSGLVSHVCPPPPPPEPEFVPFAAIADTLRIAEAYARTPHPVLITGPRGAGKTLLARWIHRRSGRSGEFVRVAAGTLSDDLGLAEVMGHTRGAFTGADRDRDGLLCAARDGTFFLDELTHATPRLQQQLLGWMEYGTIRRIGEIRSIRVTARFIAATNEPLEHALAAGRLRADLRDRFGWGVVELPPLNRRRTEIPAVARRFVDEEAQLLRLGPFHLASELLDWLVAYPWPGNLRELRAVCRHLVVCSEADEVLGCEHLPEELRSTRPGGIPSPRLRITREQALHAVTRAGGNKARAAREMGVGRSTLYLILRSGKAACGLAIPLLGTRVPPAHICQAAHLARHLFRV